MNFICFFKGEEYINGEFRLLSSLVIAVYHSFFKVFLEFLRITSENDFVMKY